MNAADAMTDEAGSAAATRIDGSGAARRDIAIDGRRYSVAPTGWDCPLDVLVIDGDPVSITLPVWRCSDHFAAACAAQCVAYDAGGEAAVAIDGARYLAALPGAEALGFPEAGADAAAGPLALWWAAGGDDTPAVSRHGDHVLIDGRAFALRRWSDGERRVALYDALRCEAAGEPPAETGDTGGGCDFDAVAYLHAMLRHGVADDAAAIDALPLHWALPLIDAVVALNEPDADTRPDAERALPRDGTNASPADARIDAVTLRLARELGWTPSQVAATPAADIDRLLTLLDREAAAAAAAAAVAPGTASPAAPRRRRLADEPDAVLIRIDD